MPLTAHSLISTDAPSLHATAFAPGDRQHQLGQFFSPRSVAELLASFAKFDGGDVRMLEASADAAAAVRVACDPSQSRARSSRPII